MQGIYIYTTIVYRCRSKFELCDIFFVKSSKCELRRERARSTIEIEFVSNQARAKVSRAVMCLIEHIKFIASASQMKTLETLSAAGTAIGIRWKKAVYI